VNIDLHWVRYRECLQCCLGLWWNRARSTGLRSNSARLSAKTKPPEVLYSHPNSNNNNNNNNNNMVQIIKYLSGIQSLVLHIGGKSSSPATELRKLTKANNRVNVILSTNGSRWCFHASVAVKKTMLRNSVAQWQRLGGQMGALTSPV